MPVCSSITPVCLYVSACDSGIDTTLTSDFTGYLDVYSEFDGIWQKTSLSLSNGEEIILPNNLNGNYTHTIKFVKPDGSLLNGTCYAFTIHSIMTSGNNLTPSHGVVTQTMDFAFTAAAIPDPSIKYTLWNGLQIPEQYLTGNPLIIPYFAGKNVHLPLFINDTLSQEVTYDKITGGFTYPFANGDKISGQYEQPI